MVNPPEPNSNRRALIILAVGLLLGLLGGIVIFAGQPLPWFSSLGAPAGTPGTPAPAPVTGAPAPDFTLKDLSDKSVTLSGLKGQVVLINFWATWCIPCREEMPAIQTEYDALKDQGFTVLAVNVDALAPDVQAYADMLKLNFPIVLDPGSIVDDLYRIRGYPTSFFVGRDGVIVREHIGAMTEVQLSGYLAQLGLKE